MFPNQFYTPAKSLLPLTKKTINWSGLLSNTQKTLNIVNQAIPIVYQVKPIINNAKTMFRVAGELAKSNSNNSNVKENVTNKQNYSNNYIQDNNNPSFFI